MGGEAGTATGGCRLVSLCSSRPEPCGWWEFRSRGAKGWALENEEEDLCPGWGQSSAFGWNFSVGWVWVLCQAGLCLIFFCWCATFLAQI